MKRGADARWRPSRGTFCKLRHVRIMSSCDSADAATCAFLIGRSISSNNHPFAEFREQQDFLHSGAHYILLTHAPGCPSLTAARTAQRCAVERAARWPLPLVGWGTASSENQPLWASYRYRRRLIQPTVTDSTHVGWVRGADERWLCASARAGATGRANGAGGRCAGGAPRIERCLHAGGWSKLEIK